MHPNDGRVVSNFIVQALRGDDITVFGDGAQTRSFCYVSDLIDGLHRMMQSADDITGPINLGNPEECTMRELAELIITLVGSTSKVVTRPLPIDDPRQRRPDISKARALLGWSPSIPMREGLAKTIDYFDTLLANPSMAGAIGR
jgi:UDP-glucuronate decarboxylase